MRARSILLATVSTFVLAGAAAAADLAVKAPPPVVTANWTGFYIGGSLGAAWQRTHTDLSDPWADEGYGDHTTHASKLGLIAGGQIGYNVQFRRFVMGIEADLSYVGTNRSTTFAWVDSGGTATLTNDGKALATVRARFGFDIADGTLIYGTAGIGWLKTQNNLVVNALDGGGVPKGGNYNASKWTPAFVVGAGIEQMVGQNWSVRGEFLWVAADTVTAPITDPHYFTASTAVRYDSTLSLWRLGANYRF